MNEVRKITVDVPVEDLAAAQKYTGAGVTDTVRAALRHFRSMQAQQELLKLRGKVKFDFDLTALRAEED